MFDGPLITTLQHKTYPGRRFTHWITVDGVFEGRSRKEKNKHIVSTMESMFGPEGQRWTWTNAPKPIIRFDHERDLLFWLMKFPTKYR